MKGASKLHFHAAKALGGHMDGCDTRIGLEAQKIHAKSSRDALLFGGKTLPN